MKHRPAARHRSDQEAYYLGPVKSERHAAAL